MIRNTLWDPMAPARVHAMTPDPWVPWGAMRPWGPMRPKGPLRPKGRLRPRRRRDLAYGKAYFSLAKAGPA